MDSDEALVHPMKALVAYHSGGGPQSLNAAIASD
jgi:hypothetical protein